MFVSTDTFYLEPPRLHYGQPEMPFLELWIIKWRV